MHAQSHPLKGIVLILSAGALLACHDGLSKYLTQFYPVFMVLWVRYLVQTLLMVLLFGPGMRSRLIRTASLPLQILRGASLIGVGVLFVTGLHWIPLAEATSVIFLTPLFVTLVSHYLGEPVSRSQWLATGVGLFGVLLVVRPGGQLFTPAVLWPLAAAFAFTLYQLLTRRLMRVDDPVASNFLGSLVGVVMMSVLVCFDWQPLSLAEFGRIAWLGPLAMTAHLLLTHAFRHASAAVLAPFSYGQIVCAAIVGLVAFDHGPDLIALLGMATIVASGFVMAGSQGLRIRKE